MSSSLVEKPTSTVWDSSFSTRVGEGIYIVFEGVENFRRNSANYPLPPCRPLSAPIFATRFRDCRRRDCWL